MKGDFSRDTFDVTRRFSRVLMQQGRVQLDADWNEQTSIVLHYLQTLAADLIGPYGGPAGSFKIETDPIFKTPDFVINAGHYYVDGILCELEATAVPIEKIEDGQVRVATWIVDEREFQEGQYVQVFDAAKPPGSSQALFQITNVDSKNGLLTLDSRLDSFQAENPWLRRVSTFQTQPNYPVPGDLRPLRGQSYLVYLDVWERHITAFEDDRIREVGLGGPDTCTRAQVVWQVKLWPSHEGDRPAGLPSELNCADVRTKWTEWKKLLQPEDRGQLKVGTPSGAVDLSQPCITPPTARYRGAENQLYRVEVHRSGSAWDSKDAKKPSAATFKWSRDNGSVVLPIAALDGKLATVTNLGWDDRLTLKPDDWVEIVDDDYALSGQPGPLAQVQQVDSARMTVTFKDYPVPSHNNQSPAYDANSTKHPMLRRWDQRAGDRTEGGLELSEGAALIEEDKWLLLEDGVQIQFTAGQYHSGDYWLIPARRATGSVEWPNETDSDGNPVPIAQAPHGVLHHYAPLAIVTFADGGFKLADDGDCHCGFDRLGCPPPP